MNDKLINCLENWKVRCSYEQSAMSEATFARFLQDLIDIAKEN